MTRPGFHARKRIRNGKIVARYHRGATQRELAKAFGLDAKTVHLILRGAGALLPEADRQERAAAGVRRKFADPDWLARRNDAVRRAVSVWPDCPPHLSADYETLRAYHGARRARAMLETAD